MSLPSLHRLALPTAMDTTPPAKAPNEDDPNVIRGYNPPFNFDDYEDSDDDEYDESMPVLRRGVREIIEEHEREMAGKRDYDEEEYVSTLRPSVKALAEEMTRKEERKRQKREMLARQPTRPDPPPVPEEFEDPSDDVPQYADRRTDFRYPPGYVEDEEEEGPIYRGIGVSQGRKTQMDMPMHAPKVFAPSQDDVDDTLMQFGPPDDASEEEKVLWKALNKAIADEESQARLNSLRAQLRRVVAARRAADTAADRELCSVCDGRGTVRYGRHDVKDCVACGGGGSV